MRALKKILIIALPSLLAVRLLLQVIPYPELEEFRKRPYSLRILDRNSNLLRVLPLDEGIRREYGPLAEIPRLIQEIFIKSEDKRFYRHYGIDPAALLRASFLNLKNGYPVSGGSTITMQLARLISPHRGGYRGKLYEMINAVRLEARLSKKEVLELWLNSIPFGMQAVGIESGSKTYFGRGVAELSRAEALALAVIPRRPVKYNPFTNPDDLRQAVNRLAGRFRPAGRVELRFQAVSPSPAWPFAAPHFVNYLKGDISPSEMSAGDDMITSLDLELNNYIEERIRYLLERYKENRLTNGAALVVNNNTGEIISYIGSRDFFDPENSGQIDGVHVTNQPGSCLKPFLYGLALDKGFLPNAILPDIPTDFGSENVYVPSNFNLRFNGPVRLRVALASSLNVPAVHLITRVGVQNFVRKLLDLEFVSLIGHEESLGSGLALGNAEISLFELVRAFASFPRGGIKLKTTWKRSENDDFAGGERVYSEYAAALISHILSDNASRALGLGTRSDLDTPFPAMFKTGTSNQFGNIWAVGATPEYTVGIWLGNFSGETVIGRTGSSIPARLAAEILTRLTGDASGDATRKAEDFPLPGHIKRVVICPLSGELVTEACSGAVYEYLPEEASIPECSYHYRDGGKIKVRYPAIFASWVERLETGDIFATSAGEMRLPKIVRPKDGAVIYLNPALPIEDQALKVEIIERNKNSSLPVYVNGEYALSLSFPYVWYFPLRRGEWTVEVRGRENADLVRFVVK